MWAGWSHERLCEEPSGNAGAPGLSAMMDVFISTLTGVAATSWPPVAPENFKYGKRNRRSMFSALINFNEKSATCSQWLPHWQAQVQILQNPFLELYREEGPNSAPNSRMPLYTDERVCTAPYTAPWGESCAPSQICGDGCHCPSPTPGVLQPVGHFHPPPNVCLAS